MAKSISGIYAKEYEVDKKIAELRLILRDRFNITGQEIERQESNLERIARRKATEVRKRLQRKFESLLKEKNTILKQHREKEVEKMKGKQQ